MKLDVDIIIELERHNKNHQLIPVSALIADAAGQLNHFCPELSQKREHKQQYTYASLVHYRQKKDALEIGYAIHQGVQVRG